MKALFPFALVLGLALVGCGKKDSTTTTNATNNAASSGNPITAPVDYLGAVAQAKKHSEKVIDTTSLNQTIQLFYAQEDRFPKDLNELVTMKYLPTLPKPPYGMRFDYDAKLGQLKVVKQP